MSTELSRKRVCLASEEFPLLLIKISQACRQCGAKKIKCDGASPRCRACVSKNTECTYGISRRNTKTRISRGIRVPSPSSQALSPNSLRSLRSPSDQSHQTYRSYGSWDSKSFDTLSLPPHISNHLFRAYFSCIHPLWPVLYKPIYDAKDYSALLLELPKALIFAMFAIAVSVQSEEDADKRIEDIDPEIFYNAAIRALENNKGDDSFKPASVNLMKPSITNCQVLAILALQQHGIAEFSQAGILCGLASSMAIELRLHRRVIGSNSAEREIQSRLWWTIFVLEKMLSCEMGRPGLLRFEESDAPFPSVEESDEYELYTPVSQNYRSSQATQTRLKLRTLTAFHSSIQLAVILEHVSAQIYCLGARQRIRQDREAGEATRLRLWLEIQEWEKITEASPLKLDLTPNLTSVPVIITNYVFIWFATILLHRPFISYWERNQVNMQPQKALDPFEICACAANNICLVLDKYSSVLVDLPCDLIFCIFIAATIQLRRYRQGGAESAQAQQYLQLCIQWLTVLGKSWKSAEARHQLLKETIEHPANSSGNTSGVSTPRPFNSLGEGISDEDALGMFLNSLPENLNLRGYEWATDEDWGGVQNSTGGFVAPNGPFFAI